MKTFLLIYLIASGVDHGGPAIEMPTLAECKTAAQTILSKGVPDGVDILRVGCVQELRAGNPA